jgi:hypothetical protein
MLSGRSIAAIGSVVILGMVGGAQAFDGFEYPDWRGQWVGFLSPKLSANGPGQAFAGWDQTKPWGLGQQAIVAVQTDQDIGGVRRDDVFLRPKPHHHVWHIGWATQGSREIA